MAICHPERVNSSLCLVPELLFVQEVVGLLFACSIWEITIRGLLSELQGIKCKGHWIWRRVTDFNCNWWANNLPEQMGRINSVKISYGPGVNKKVEISVVLSSSVPKLSTIKKMMVRGTDVYRQWVEGTWCSFPLMKHLIEAAHAWNWVSVGELQN